MDSKEFTTAPILNRLMHYTQRNGSIKLFIKTSSIIYREATKPELEKRVILYGYSFKLAIKYNDLPAIRWLNKHGYKSDFYFLHEASKYGHLEMVKFFLERGVKYKRSLIDIAAENGHFELVKWLHTNKKSNCTTDAIDMAAKNGHLEIVKWLYENGETYTQIAVSRATANGHFELVKYFYAINSRYFSENSIDDAGANGHIHICKWLVEMNVKSCSKESLRKAILNGDLETVKWFHINVNNEDSGYLGKNYIKRSVDLFYIYTAAMCGHLHIIKWFYENYQIIVEKDDKGKIYHNPLNSASLNGFLDVIIWFYQNTNLSCTNEAIINAAKEGHLNVVEYLCLNKYEELKEGLTQAYYEALNKRYTKICEFLEKNIK